MLATAAGAIGGIIVAIVIIGFVVAIITNMRRARPEVGAELELAANRKPYLSDEELEGKKLDRTLAIALVLTVVVAITLPLYWLAEPSRQTDEIKHYNEVYVERGLNVYLNLAKCVNCHGPNGVGGAATYTLTNANGDYVAQVQWKAPALNNVLFRYSEAEVFNILEYGRPPSPMPAWGSLGGGPFSDQELLDVIAYLRSIQLNGQKANAGGRDRDQHRLQARRQRQLHALRQVRRRQVADARRGAVQPRRVRRLRRRRLRLRPLPHPGLVLRPSRRWPVAAAVSART